MPEPIRDRLRHLTHLLWNEGRLEAVDELYTEDCIYHTSTINEELHGRVALKRYVAEIRSAFPDFKVFYRETVMEGPTVASRWHWEGNHRGPWRGHSATHKHMTGEGMSFVHMRGDQIREHHLMQDDLNLMRQIGAVEDKVPVENRIIL